MRTKTYITGRKHHGKTSTLENLLYVPCKKYLKKTNHPCFEDVFPHDVDSWTPTLEAKEMSKWFSASDSPGMLMKRVVFLYRRCKESNKTYEKYHICYIYIYMCVHIIFISHMSYVYLRYFGDLASGLIITLVSILSLQ